ncbi:TRAP transporter small permease [Pseudogemmobacter faecipullorum]|uniref:TRAP transporter small permease protein n=1 Tax=Pseudogemmobacter faecipullorum TaxID=2755041 RepID=A0ABS8CNL7_9RHOB|nr:TRAP transporter small permease [Pseudogemmobacter faecipullorum]MCB5410790.1 TRAP transporter small permease [Pseudogemmobacter faecipullorum]
MSLNRARTAITSLNEAVILVLFAAMILATMAQVISRYVFNAPLIWSEELSRYLFIWISFLGAWLAWVSREHLGIDILPHVLPPRLKRPGQVLIELTVLIFALASMYFGRKILSVSLGQPSAVLRLPMFWIYLSYYICMILISLEILLGWIGGQRPRPVGVAP